MRAPNIDFAQPMETEILDIEKPWVSAFRQNGGEKLDWTLTVRVRRSVDVIYFDFAKAFDSVSHSKLVLKLQADGICGNVLNILTDFLFDRSQRVVLSNAASTFLPAAYLSEVF